MSGFEGSTDQLLKRLDDLDALDDSLKWLVAQRLSDLADAYSKLAALDWYYVVEGEPVKGRRMISFGE